MTAVLASYVSYRGMVDGTLRVTLDIEPKDVAAAHQLFSKPGAPVAIARLTDAAAQKASQTPATIAGQEGGVPLTGPSVDGRPAASPSERKVLTLPQKVALTCQERSFHIFLKDRRPHEWRIARNIFPLNEERAAAVVRDCCNVSSRSAIVIGSDAALLWEKIEADYLDYQRRAS